MSLKTIGQISLEAQLLVDALEKVKLNETISYEVLSTACGRNAQTEARGILNTARNRLLRDQRMAFGAVRGLGLRRLDDSGKVTEGASTLVRIRSKARKGMRTLAAVDDFASMAPEDRLTHNAAMSLLAMMHQGGSSKKLEKVKQLVNTETRGALPMKKLLEGLRSS